MVQTEVLRQDAEDLAHAEKGPRRLKNVPTFRRQVRGRDDDDADELVSAPAALRIRHPFPAKSEERVGLRARGDPETRRALQRRDLDLRAERRLAERDWQIHHEVRTLAVEHG